MRAAAGPGARRMGGAIFLPARRSLEGRRRPLRSGAPPLLWAVWLLAFASAPALSAAQDRSPQSSGARIVAFTNEPREPELGDVFQLDVRIRVAPDVVAFLSDTMTDAQSSVSAGSGHWTVEPGPADSLTVRASYPVMGFLPGGVELPYVEIWTRPTKPGEVPGVHASSELPESQRDASDVEHAQLYLGGVFIMPPAEMTGDEAVLEPRPPADVLGGEVSTWLIAAIVVAVASAGIVAGLMLAGRTGRVPPPPLLSPRDEALRELDRLRDLGWHTNGRIVEFYDATTGILRQYAERRNPAEWRAALTSSELLARLEGQGTNRIADLRPTVWTAECVKFGTRRPDSDTAEQDWSHVRDWIEREAGT